MEIKKLEENDRSLKLLIKDSNPAFMNAMRRLSMNDIPILAIEDVLIDKNNSALFDEIIAQRLGQVPLRFDPENFNFKEECDCEDGCPNCQARFSLEKEGPGTVYSGDLVSKNSEVGPLYQNMPITQLDENQEIKLETVAILGTGGKHSKHQAAISSYQYYPKIEIDQDKLQEGDVKKYVEVCPRNVFEETDGKLDVKDEKKCTLCNECIEEVDSEAVKIESDEEKFIFKIESVSSLEPKEILNKTTEILKEKADKVIQKIE